ncbi:hypothetical protein FBQ97_21735 [Acidobacteria bacterium ACD]|nr:MAG: hypothetical protein EDX89_12660 [Acidobacteriota bacterium]MCE7957972.1 hypothetical protein [Acidobacteria bacterium ACB2]MDL1952407.1 hypothetical protein [Acidobacteria bacterium ACD]
MSEIARVKPDSRSGQVGQTWGNLLLPEGRLSVHDRFLFEGEESAPFEVKRVLSWPLDPKLHLVYYESTKRHG